MEPRCDHPAGAAHGAPVRRPAGYFAHHSRHLELRTEMTDVAAIVDAAIETARPALDAKRHTLKVELLVPSGRRPHYHRDVYRHRTPRGFARLGVRDVLAGKVGSRPFRRVGSESGWPSRKACWSFTAEQFRRRVRVWVEAANSSSGFRFTPSTFPDERRRLLLKAKTR